MIYLCWLLFVVVYVFGYKFLIDTFGDKSVDVRKNRVKMSPSNINTIRHYPLSNSTGAVCSIQRFAEEKKRKSDIREQYLTWRENSKAVNEYHNRRHELLIQSG